MPRKRPPTVPQTFSNQIGDLAKRVVAEGWGKKYGLDVATLEADSKAQVKEAQEHSTQQQAFVKLDKKFKAEQGGRYGRYIAVLEVLRAVFMNQPDVLASLERFKRPSVGKRKKAAPATPKAP